MFKLLLKTYVPEKWYGSQYRKVQVAIALFQVLLCVIAVCLIGVELHA